VAMRRLSVLRTLAGLTGHGRSTTMPSRAAKTRTGAAACCATRSSISASARHGSWWNSASCRALARCASATAYSTAEWPKAQPRQLGRGVLGIVHQQVGVLGQRDSGVVYSITSALAGLCDVLGMAGSMRGEATSDWHDRVVSAEEAVSVVRPGDKVFLARRGALEDREAVRRGQLRAGRQLLTPN
jgi:hypothetical protein